MKFKKYIIIVCWSILSAFASEKVLEKTVEALGRDVIIQRMKETIFPKVSFTDELVSDILETVESLSKKYSTFSLLFLRLISNVSVS